MWYFFTFAEIMQVYVLTCFCHHIPEQLAVGRNAVESGRFAYFPRNQTKARGARTLSKHRRSHEIGGVQISGFDIVSIAFPYSQSQSCWISSPLVTFLITQSSFSTSPGGEYSNKKKCSSNNAAGLATFGVHFLVFFSSLFWKVAFSSEQVGLFLFYQSASSLSTDSVFLRKSLFSNGKKKRARLICKILLSGAGNCQLLNWRLYFLFPRVFRIPARVFLFQSKLDCGMRREWCSWKNQPLNRIWQVLR